MTAAPPCPHSLRVAGPDGFFFEVPDADFDAFGPAHALAARLARWLGVGRWHPEAAAVPKPARRLRRDIARCGIDPLHCRVQVVIPAPPSYAAPHGYRCVAQVGVAAAREGVVA